MYYPATNKRGDVVAIYNSVGNCIVKYEYDAWGNVIAVVDDSGINLAEINPIRYRGYYYDVETKFYYLQSRYYNPEVGRFLNSDSISDSGAGVLGFNTFIYCANNPVNASDPSGHFVLSAILIGAAVGAAVSAISDFGCQLMSNGWDVKKVDPVSVVKSAVIGGVCGAISGGIGGAVSSYGVSQVTQAATDIVVGGCSNVVETFWKSEGKTSFSECVKSFVVGCATSAIGVGATKVVQHVNGKVFRSFSNETQKQLLNSNSYGKTYTTAMVSGGTFLKDSAYFECVSGGTTLASNAWSSASLLFVDFFSEERSK